MTAPRTCRLGVDLGTSTTIAMLRWPDGRVRPLLFDGSPLLSSAVFLGADGRLHTGRDAAHLARGNPERLEPNPKRRVDDDVVLLGAGEVPVRDLLAAILRRVADEATRVAGPITDVTLTHPAAWGVRRCGLLVAAAEAAGLPRPQLITEPEAAARYFATTMASAVPPGGRLLVYDLGAGTCDLTLLRRAPHGFDVIASDGLNDVGGLDVDAAIVAFLEATYGPLWTDAASRGQVWDEVRSAKEMLSRASGTVISVPALGREAPLGREQFNGLVGPVLRQTISMTKALLRDASGAGAPTSLVLVGGASRIPLVAHMLYEATGIPPIVTEQPELVVAEGALYAAPQIGFGAGTTAAAPVSPPLGPPAAQPVSPPFGQPVAQPVSPAFGAQPVSPPFGQPPGPQPAAPPRPPTFGVPVQPFVPPGPVRVPAPAPPRAPGSRRTLLIVAAIAVLLVLGAGSATAIWLTRPDGNRGTFGGPSNAPATPSNGATTPSTPSTQGVPNGPEAGRFAQNNLPENLCGKVSIGRLEARFPEQIGPPTAQRNLSTTLSTASCTVSRQRGTQVILTLLYTTYVFADRNVAVSTHKAGLDNAKLNDANTATVPDIGEEAFLTLGPSNTTTESKAASYQLEVRDSNLRTVAYFTATAITDPVWTASQREQLKAELIEAVRATHRNLTAA